MAETDVITGSDVTDLSSSSADNPVDESSEINNEND